MLRSMPHAAGGAQHQHGLAGPQVAAFAQRKLALIILGFVLGASRLVGRGQRRWLTVSSHDLHPVQRRRAGLSVATMLPFKRHLFAPVGHPDPLISLDALIASFRVNSGRLRAGESGRGGPSQRSYAGLP